MNPWQITRSVKSLNRLRQIALVLTQHGFGHVVAQMNLSRFVPVWMVGKQRKAAKIQETPSSIGRRLTLVCSELGPTFVKLGQLLSTRADMLPASILSELRSLQDEVPPFETSQAMSIIAKALGKPVEESFAWIGDHPIASGSIGQVYRAHLHDDTRVIVKIRRPNITDTIRLDLNILRWLADSLDTMAPELRIYRPRVLVAELEEMLLRELDYVHEAATTSRFAKAFATDPDVFIPQVYWDFCTPDILTMDELVGEKLGIVLDRTRPSPIRLDQADIDQANSDRAEAEPSFDRSRIGQTLTDAYIKQVFELGLFHTDPHPGNIIILPSDRVGFIDFGQAGEITDELVTQLIVMIYACVNREISIVIDTLADFGAISPDTDHQALQKSLQTLLNKYYGLPLKRLDLGTLVNEFTDLFRKHDVIMPREAIALMKGAGMIGSITAQLDPDLNLVERLQPQIEKALKDRFAPKRLLRGATISAWHVLSVLRQAPAQLHASLRRAAVGRWQLNVKHENLERLIGELDRSSNRLAFSIIIAAIIIGSSMVLTASSDLVFFGIRVQHFGLFGYLVAGVLGLALIWAIFRSGRLH